MSLRLQCSLILHLLCLSWLAQATYWMETIPRRGQVAFQPNATYPVFRNVKDPLYGAYGDGIHDDTAAINNAISAPGVLGNTPRCGGGSYPAGQTCPSQTTTPALVYFPPGNYSVSSPIVLYYFTQMVGDANNPPNIFVAANFSNKSPILGVSVFDANIYIPGFGGGGKTWWDNQNNFYRQIRNFRFDLTQAPISTSAIHWQVAQATSLQNIGITMRDPTYPGNNQVGINMENGSGGFFSDVTISGGIVGLSIGSQQFTTRNVKIDNCKTAVKMVYNWIWTFAQFTITNCAVGFDFTNGGFNNQATSAVVIIDSLISATVGIISLYAPGYSGPQSGGTLMLERVDFTDSPTAIAVGTDPSSRVILAGNQYINLFGQGNAWTTAGQALNGQAFNGTSCTFQNNSQTVHTAQELTIQRQLAPIQRPQVLTDAQGNIVGRSRPQYENVPVTSFLSAKASGLLGDGVTPQTAQMQLFFNTAAQNGQVAYLDKGAYVVDNTINVPPNLKITGELQTIVMATGTNFGNQNAPIPMWKIGQPGQSGTVEISDVVFEALGPVPGCIFIEWNIKQATPAGAGMWDANFRIGGSAGTNLQSDKCLKAPATPIQSGSQVLSQCAGAFMLVHVTPQADFYMENCWGWVADHDLDLGNRDQVDIFNGRGFLIESNNGPVWMWGTAAEHSTLYNYQFVNVKNAWMGHMQHETAYFQGNPNALLPFAPQASWNDPDFSECAAEKNPTLGCVRTWATRYVNCQQIYNYGAGHYNFFNNWDSPGCLSTEGCQERMVGFFNSTEIYVWGLSTKGSTYMVSWDGTSLVPQAVNKASYVETILLFEMVKDQ